MVESARRQLEVGERARSQQNSGRPRLGASWTPRACTSQHGRGVASTPPFPPQNTVRSPQNKPAPAYARPIRWIRCCCWRRWAGTRARATLFPFFFTHNNQPYLLLLLPRLPHALTAAYRVRKHRSSPIHHPHFHVRARRLVHPALVRFRQLQLGTAADPAPTSHLHIVLTLRRQILLRMQEVRLSEENAVWLLTSFNQV